MLMLVLGLTACGAMHRPPGDSMQATLPENATPSPPTVDAVAVETSAAPAIGVVTASPLVAAVDVTASVPAADVVGPASVRAPVNAPPARTAPRLGCDDHPSVDAWTRRLTTERRSSTRALLARGARMLPELKRIVADAGAPAGLALVPAIESAFRADARGQRGERGLWQLKPHRARQLGLVVSAARDDRTDPALATHAATRHLLALHGTYGDWALALAAYVAGEGRVDRALRERRGGTFWQLAEERRLPATAHDFVAHVFALVRIAAPEACEPAALSL
jgi:membrane-bound lytic murein transglycosylase D